MMKSKILTVFMWIILASLITTAAFAEAFQSVTVSTEEVTDTEVELQDDAASAPTPAPTDNSDANQTAESTETDSKNDELAGNANDVGAAGGLGFDKTGFIDCVGHWAEEAIGEYSLKKFLNGYEDNTFRPDNYVTFAEFAKIFSARRGTFYQITNGYWATPYIRLLIDEGIFSPTENYSDFMTREDVAAVVVKYIKSEYFPSNLNKYSALLVDYNQVSEEFKESVVKSFITGIITGYPDNTYRSKANVTRAEILTIIERTVSSEKREIPKSVTQINEGSSEAEQTEIYVLADTAEVEGGMLNIIGTGENAYVENFRTNQKMTFHFDSRSSGTYKMKVYYSANINSGGGTAKFDVNGKQFDHTFKQTGAWNAYVYEDLEDVTINSGENTIVITDGEIPNTYLINVKNIVFEKVDQEENK